MTLADSFFSPVAGHFPNNALGSEFTVEARAEAFTALFDIQTLATLFAKPGFVLLTDGKGLTIRVVSTLHLFLPSTDGSLSRIFGRPYTQGDHSRNNKNSNEKIKRKRVVAK